MSQHKRDVADYAINDLTPDNSMVGQALETAYLSHKGYLFAIDVWTKLHNGKAYPFHALIVQTPQGWKVLSQAWVRWDDPDTENDEFAEGQVYEFQDPELELKSLARNMTKGVQEFLAEQQPADPEAPDQPHEFLQREIQKRFFINDNDEMEIKAK